MSVHFPDVPATFIHLPRTGGTSFEQWANTNIINVELYDWKKADPTMFTFSKLKSHWSNLGTTFTFVRNPYDRLVSMFHNRGQRSENAVKMYKDKLNSNQQISDWKVHPYQSDNFISALLDETSIVELYQKGFTNWLTCLHSNPQELYNSVRPGAHKLIKWWADPRSQLSMLNNQTPDIVVKLESVERDFVKIQQLLNCDVPLPNVNRSVHADYRQYYNDQTKQIVENMFADDLDTFKYSF